MYFLDTHIILWLYQLSLELLSEEAKKAIEENDIFVSPIVVLELQYLFEIGRIRDDSQTIIEYLRSFDYKKFDCPLVYLSIGFVIFFNSTSKPLG